jgi:predicted kinase
MTTGDGAASGGSRPFLIVVTGSPASGKTTIAESLSEQMHLPLIAKDAIKEELYDTLEGAEPSDSHRLGYVAIRLMQSWARRLLEKDVAVIVESNFKRSLSLDDLQELFALSRPVLVQCVAPEADVIKRYVERSEEGERHPVHDDANHVDELRRDLEKGEYDLRDAAGILSVTIDTSKDDQDAVIREAIIRIRTILEGQLVREESFPR